MRGQADAISLAEDYLDSDLMVIFVDTLFGADLSVVTNLKDADGMAFVSEVPDPSRFGIAVVGKDGYITKLVEKPQNPESNLALVGLYYFKDARWLVRAIHTLMDSGRSLKGEYYLADAIQVMIDEGAKMLTQTVSVWEDTGTFEAVLHANRHLLRGMDAHTEPYMVGSSLVVPPCYISPDAYVEHSIIGPYTSVSEGAEIRDSIVKNSIISAKAKVTGAMLFGALIGERSQTQGSYQVVNLGDDSTSRIVGADQATIDETFT